MTTRGADPAGVRVTRREALRRLLFTGGGLLAAGAVGCGARGADMLALTAAEGSAGPPPTIEAASTPAASATPTATAAATPPTVAPDLRLNMIPRSLVIPAVGIDAPVGIASMYRNAQGRSEITVPDSGIVTPNASLGRNSTNNGWILGHSQWRGVPQLLYPLGGLNVGDTVEVDAYEQAKQRTHPGLPYVVTRVVLTDREAGVRVVYGPRPRPRVVIQTSVRENGVYDWILDRGMLEAKAEVVLDGPADDLHKYLLLMVVAELTDVGEARVRA